jgi:hypothetical protein
VEIAGCSCNEMELLTLRIMKPDGRKRRLNALLSFVFAAMLGPGASQAQIFSSDSVLRFELRLDLDSLKADVGEDPSYHDGILVYEDPADRSRHELRISVRARGNFRKKPENCDFPPLKLKFDKTQRQGSIFEDLRELKLVTHCQSDLDEFEQYLLQEYLIYKSYNLFTDFSFRVRLARITYVDMEHKSAPFTRFAFLLEDEEDMARRNQSGLLELKTISNDKLDRDYFALMSMFNFMMLNTDYSIPIVHNVVLVYTDNFKPPIPVPFDFDWSGMINIPYESPYASRETRYAGRKYKGPCLRGKELKKVFNTMLSRRNELYQLYREFPYLNEDLRSRSLQELDMFYIIIGNRKLVRQEFIRKCRD